MKEKQEDLFPEIRPIGKGLVKLREFRKTLEKEDLLKLQKWQKEQKEKMRRLLEENPNLLNLTEEKK